MCTCCNIDGIGIIGFIIGRYWNDTLSTEACQKVISHGVVGDGESKGTVQHLFVDAV
jgi:hypothetical protein